MNCLFTLSANWFIFAYFSKHKGRNKHWLQSQIVTPWWPTRWFFRFSMPNIYIWALLSALSYVFCSVRQGAGWSKLLTLTTVTAGTTQKEKLHVVNRSIYYLLLITIPLGTKLRAGLIHLTKFASLLLFFCPPIASLWHPFLDSGRCRWT